MNGSLHNFGYFDRRTIEREAGILLSPISAGAAMSLGLGSVSNRNAPRNIKL